MHLRGAYSLASSVEYISAISTRSLMSAGFWNYLREDITFSLFERCPLKLQLDKFEIESEESNLHSISFILAKLINSCFDKQLEEADWRMFNGLLSSWLEKLPATSRPYAESAPVDQTLPQIWFMEDHHGRFSSSEVVPGLIVAAAAMHYFLIATTILCQHAPNGSTSTLYRPPELSDDADTEILLDHYALRICGIAFTTNIPSVLVNAFGPMHFCESFRGRHHSPPLTASGIPHIKNKAAQDEIIRRLMATKKDIGWPVERLVASLDQTWAVASSGPKRK